MKFDFNTNAETICDLYNKLIEAHKLIYMPLDVNNVHKRFFGVGKICIVAFEKDLPIGFVAGTIDESKRGAYISFFGVMPDYCGTGIGSALLLEFEKNITSNYEIEKIETVFHNPTHLPWKIPHKIPHAHPCTPGVDVVSDAYVFLKNHEYRDYAMQNAYYINLKNYSYPFELVESEKKLNSQGIEITFYNEQYHKGLYELFDNINNIGWRNTVMAGIDKPIIVAIDTEKQLVCGYTGPLSTDEYGRGNFCGIGTHTDYRGHGIAKLIFAHMCRYHSENGAEYMSLYTGETNPARNIYEAAGFSVVRSFANMRKIIK